MSKNILVCFFWFTVYINNNMLQHHNTRRCTKIRIAKQVIKDTSESMCSESKNTNPLLHRVAKKLCKFVFVRNNFAQFLRHGVYLLTAVHGTSILQKDIQIYTYEQRQSHCDSTNETNHTVCTITKQN